MKVGQRVMVIAIWRETDCVPPPIGAMGEITEAMDCDGDYFVLIPEWPCPNGEPDWYIPHWALIPIDADEAPQFDCKHYVLELSS